MIQKGIIHNFVYNEKSTQAQFLLVSHNPLLMDKNLFAKEQIYFVEKDHQSQQSIVYSLKDFDNITYNNHSWLNIYMSGRIGAVPEVFD